MISLLFPPYFLVPFFVIIIWNHDKNENIRGDGANEIKPEEHAVNHRGDLLPLRHDQLPLVQRRPSSTNFRCPWPLSVCLKFPVFVFGGVVVIPRLLGVDYFAVPLLWFPLRFPSLLQWFIFLLNLVIQSFRQILLCLAGFSSISNELIFQRKRF